jgi:hypothetical protein
MLQCNIKYHSTSVLFLVLALPCTLDDAFLNNDKTTAVTCSFNVVFGIGQFKGVGILQDIN